MSDTNSIPEKILARIQKLMAVAQAGEGRVNENEAMNAASMAQELAAQFNLELSQVELQSPSETPGGKREKKTHDRAAMYNFQRKLMKAIAEVNFCRWWLAEESAVSFGKLRTVKRHMLLGRDINVRATIMMYDYLVETMDRLLPYQGTEKRGKNALAWLDGCTDRLAERLALKKDQMVAEGNRRRKEEEARAKHPGAAPSSNALVLADVYSSEEDFNNDFINGWEPGTTAKKRVEQQALYAAAQAKRQARYDALIEVGYSPPLARLIGYYGYTEENAIAAIAAIAKEQARRAKVESKAETEAQRRKREEREARDSARFNQRRYKQSLRYSDPAYRAGSRQGDQIGLDDQVTGAERRGIK